MPNVCGVPSDGTPVTAQLHASAQTSMVPGTPSQMKVTVKQHEVPGTTAADAATLIQPVHPGGTGLGAGVKFSFSSVAVNPGQRPAIDDEGPGGVLQKTSVWMWLEPIPGFTSRPVKCFPTCPLPPGPLQLMSTLPDQLVSGGHGEPAGGPPPGRSLGGS